MAERWEAVQAHAIDAGRDPADITFAVYLTMTLDENADRADQRMTDYLGTYYKTKGENMRRIQAHYAGSATGAAEWLQSYARHRSLTSSCVSPVTMNSIRTRSYASGRDWAGDRSDETDHTRPCKKKASGERLAMVAVGEYLSAQWAERAGVDIVGVGDSLGMTLYGHETTLPMTVEQMIEHTKAVRRGCTQHLLPCVDALRVPTRRRKLR